MHRVDLEIDTVGAEGTTDTRLTPRFIKHPSTPYCRLSIREPSALWRTSGALDEQVLAKINYADARGKKQYRTRQCCNKL